jgi:hypothetical protein
MREPMNTALRGAGGAFLMLFLASAGCDQRSDAPQPPASAPAAAGSTTQDLLSQPPVTLPLGALPFTIDAPPGWKIETLADKFDFLTGPAPLGVLQVAMDFRPSATQDQINYLFQGAKNEQNKQPERYVDVRLEKVNDLQLFQCVKQDPAAPPAMVDPSAAGNLSPATTTQGNDSASSDAINYEWTIAIFSPDGDRFQQYTLDFEGLTKQQYDADGDFFRAILHTLRTRDMPALPQ